MIYYIIIPFLLITIYAFNRINNKLEKRNKYLSDLYNQEVIRNSILKNEIDQCKLDNFRFCNRDSISTIQDNID